MGRRRLIRAGLVLLFLTGLVTLAGGTAQAVSIPTIPVPGGGLINSLCPTKNAPNPELPDDGLPAGSGDYETYGYGGLFWTTFDQSCLSVAKLDNTTGNMVNDLATGVDGIVNQAQAAALDPHFTDPLRRVVDHGAPVLASTFLSDKWLLTGLAGAALMVQLAILFGRETEAVRNALSVFVVLGALFFLLHDPGQISRASARATQGVASSAGQALATATGTPVQGGTAGAFTDGYYTLSYRAWADGAFCSNRAAEDRWAKRIRADQAYTVAEKTRIEADPAAAKTIKKAKQDDWVKAANQMSKQDPVAFDCWSDSTSFRAKSGVRHFIVSVSAGVWVLIASFGILVLQDMLMFGILLAIGLGAVMIALRSVAARMLRFIALAAVGGSVLALVLGILLTGYFIILADPTLTWITSAISACALGAAIWLSKTFLRQLLVGTTHGDPGMARQIGRAASKVGRAGVNAVLVGTGAAAGATAERIFERRHEHTESGDDRRQDWMDETMEPAGEPRERETDSGTLSGDDARPDYQPENAAEEAVDEELAWERPSAPAGDSSEWGDLTPDLESDTELSWEPADSLLFQDSDESVDRDGGSWALDSGISPEQEANFQRMSHRLLEQHSSEPVGPHPDDPSFRQDWQDSYRVSEVYRPQPMSDDRA